MDTSVDTLEAEFRRTLTNAREAAEFNAFCAVMDTQVDGLTWLLAWWSYKDVEDTEFRMAKMQEVYLECAEELAR